MSRSKTLILLYLLLSGIGTLYTVLCEPDLNPSVPDGSTVYVNQPVTINCITRGSQAMAWRSDEYIGPGQQLRFNSGSTPGVTDTSSNGAQATFVRMYHDNGDLMLHSILRISVASIYSSFTVTCRNIDTGSTESVTYQTLNENITSVIVLPFEEKGTCPNSNVVIECTARNSHNIEWRSSDYIGLSNIMPRCSSGDESQTYNIPGIGVISFNVQVSDNNGLVCRLTLPSENLPVDVPLYITCTNLDFRIGANVSFQISDCISTTPKSTSVTSSSSNFGSESMATMAIENAAPKPESRSVSYAVIGGGVGGGLLLLSIIIIVCTIIIIIKVVVHYNVMRKGSKRTEPVPIVDHKDQLYNTKDEEANVHV